MPAKRVVQDIVPLDIRPRRSAKEVAIPIVIKRKNIRSKIKPPSETPSPKFKHSKSIAFTVVFACIAIIALALSLLYTKAIVTITPTTIPLNIDGNFIAKKDNTNPDLLTYQIMTVTLDDTKTIPATDGPLIQTKAKGTITLYNNYSSTTQKILAGTRILSNKNLIYKTTWSITIPGKKVLQGKTVPGSIDVGIIADQVGAEYNVAMSDLAGDFKILAYKGSDKYQGFYGRIKKEIEGGFSGKKKIISPELEKATNLDLEKRLKDKLLEKISSSMLDGLVFFDNAYTIEYQKLPTINTDTDMATIGMKGTLNGIIFNSKDLIEFITKKPIQESKLSSYKVDGLKTLDFSIVNIKDFSAKKTTTLSFNLRGPVKITGTFSEKDLKNKLLGIKLDQMTPIVKQYPSIKSVAVLLTPFWMRSFPSSADNIIIEYK